MRVFENFGSKKIFFKVISPFFVRKIDLIFEPQMRLELNFNINSMIILNLVLRVTLSSPGAPLIRGSLSVLLK